MTIQEILSNMSTIDAAIRVGGLPAGMQAILALDPDASLRVRYEAIKDPLFAPAMRDYNDRRYAEYRRLENSRGALVWYGFASA
jgi:hypothetical protein